MSNALKYKTNGEIREEIAYAVGADPSRYGAYSEKGLNKAHMQRIALKLEPDQPEVNIAALDLEGLYEWVCKWAGGEHEPNTGNVWGINRRNLKKIHDAVGGEDPRRVPSQEAVDE